MERTQPPQPLLPPLPPWPPLLPWPLLPSWLPLPPRPPQSSLSLLLLRWARSCWCSLSLSWTLGVALRCTENTPGFSSSHSQGRSSTLTLRVHPGLIHQDMPPKYFSMSPPFAHLRCICASAAAGGLQRSPISSAPARLGPRQSVRPPRSSPTVLFLLFSQPLCFCTRCSLCLNTLHWAENNSLRPLSAVASFGTAAAAVPLPAPRPAEPPVFFSSHAPSTSPWPPFDQLTMSILNAFSASAEPHWVKGMPVMFTTISPPPSPRLVHSDAQKRSVDRPCEGAFMSSCRRNSPRVLSSLGFPTTSKPWKTQGAGRAPGAMASPSGRSEATGKPRGMDGGGRRPSRREEAAALAGGGSAQPEDCEDGEDTPRPGRKETGPQTGGDGRGAGHHSPVFSARSKSSVVTRTSVKNICLIKISSTMKVILLRNS
nr:uncharacterized protein LOC112204176 isoform X3 [Pan troglodytes]XP_054512530.1 uncharacterized protein LOC112204176 isoform X3 [Pan troglodytes]XP_054512531.1 uncharacterized protein LOC112204176 isoform X3 [Pan troglodytes]